MKRFLPVFVFLMIPIIFSLSGCGPKTGAHDNRDKAIAFRELGEAYMAEGNYTMALRELLKAEQLYPNDPYLHNSLGLAYMGRGRSDRAVSHFRRAVELNPNYSPARNNLGSVYIALEQWDEAIACFEKVKDDLLYATPYFPLSNLGYVYYMKGDYEKSRRYYQDALAMERRFPRALHGLGRVALATGNAAEAVRRFEQALEVVPTAANIYVDLGRAYEQQHEYRRALNAYETAMSMMPDTPLADEAEEAIRMLRQRW